LRIPEAPDETAGLGQFHCLLENAESCRIVVSLLRDISFER
jgi:hypothetical protein